MNEAVINFFYNNLNSKEVEGKTVIELGSQFVNGTVRFSIENLNPSKYIGIDQFPGPCVDLVLKLEDTLNYFKEEKFDIVVSTEMLEHCLDFRLAINIIKSLVKVGGLILISTRSIGFGIHGFPYDFWRFQKEDLKKLFSDFKILSLEDDLSMPGVFMKAQKECNVYQDISSYELYNIIYEKKVQCDPEQLLEHIKTSKSTYTGHKRSDNYFKGEELFYKGCRRNTDKVNHNYLNKYEFFLNPFKHEHFNLLELGVFRGSSLMMWYDYFKNANIFGVDINRDCVKFSNDRINIHILNLDDLNSYSELYNNRYKIIIDDASHFWDHQIFSFFNLFSVLESGGIYIIEDLQTNFGSFIKDYSHGSDISCVEMLLNMTYNVVSDYTFDSSKIKYHVIYDKIARCIDMISYIQKSCIIVKK